MSRIKTRESVKDIKVIDKAAVASERMKTALVRSKDQFENLMDDGQVTPSEYAEDKIRYAAEDVADRVGHDVSSETKKAKRLKNGSIAMKSSFAEWNRPEPRGHLLRSLIHINLPHEHQSHKALRRRGASLHPNGKLSLRSKTVFGRGRTSTSRTP